MIWIRISGGDMYVKASGDGIDSNGNFTWMVECSLLKARKIRRMVRWIMRNGRDYRRNFLGTGNSGMAMAFSDSSTQCSVNVVADTMYLGPW
ncbi:MAG: hypothetical protein ACLSFZ_07000 [Frisingicoccus sp.]